ncbi:unnamed protein product [Albugo candida]|uniref:Uncharacterized protein n=1 Tax=Albugo candida TaxID=65357 RepID=A0A024GPC5_9STRA|nr:unnamed protein product [Albugo candida]|eukprot:CCI48580.1 unnamed protein product [Albugo candida]
MENFVLPSRLLPSTACRYPIAISWMEVGWLSSLSFDLILLSYTKILSSVWLSAASASIISMGWCSIFAISHSSLPLVASFMLASSVSMSRICLSIPASSSPFPSSISTSAVPLICNRSCKSSSASHSHGIAALSVTVVFDKFPCTYCQLGVHLAQSFCWSEQCVSSYQKLNGLLHVWQIPVACN